MKLHPSNFDWFKKMTGELPKDSGLSEGTAALGAEMENAAAKKATPQPYVVSDIIGSSPTEPDFGDGDKMPVPDEQKFIMRIGVQSNCNVSVQSKNLGGTWPRRTAYRLICDQCKEASTVDAKVVESHHHDHPVIVEFCKTHRHDVEASVSATVEGRRFRDAV